MRDGGGARVALTLTQTRTLTLTLTLTLTPEQVEAARRGEYDYTGGSE